MPDQAPNVDIEPGQGGRLVYDKERRTIIAERAAWKIPSPRDYLAIKYSAPPGTCKCGDCQLVPPEMLMTWAAEIDALKAQVKHLRVVKV